MRCLTVHMAFLPAPQTGVFFIAPSVERKACCSNSKEL